jgi:ubiquinone/menaquinone biosynthesis C-methylase UbiE
MNLNLYNCPNCKSHLIIEDDSGILCKHCGEHYPSYFGIVDFRLSSKDTTASFSIEKDLILAKSLQTIYDSVETFNGLFYIYDSLRKNVSSEIEITDDILKITLQSSKKYDKPLSQNQIFHGFHIINRLDLFMKEAGWIIQNKDICLENGCGHGFFIEGLSKNFDKLIVLDFSLCYLMLAKKICDERGIVNTDLICANAENPPIKQNTVDFIHSNNVIEHVSNQAAMIAGMFDILKEQGILFLLSPNINSAYFEPHFRLPFFGLIPFPIRHWLIWRLQGRDCRTVTPLSLPKLNLLIKNNFNGDIIISFLPRGLTNTTSGGLIRKFIVLGLTNKFIGGLVYLTMNKLFLYFMPYHVALCKKA